MKPLSLDNLDNYLALRKELTSRDPYVLQANRKDLEAQLDCYNSIPGIFLFEFKNDYVGFIETDQSGDTLYIENIFLSPSVTDLKSSLTLEGFETMLQETLQSTEGLSAHQIKYIGPINRDSLEQSFVNTGFILTKEHIQMEMPLTQAYSYEQELSFSYFSDFKDATRLYDFMKSSMSGTLFNYSKEEVVELIQTDNPLALILWIDSQPAGFVIAHINAQRNKQQGQQVVYIEQIAISPIHRNRGFAGKLLEVIFSKAQSQAIDIARLHVYSDNSTALKLYKKLGFAEVKRIGHWIFEYK